MLENKSSKKLQEILLSQTLINSAFRVENFMKIGYEMTSGECFENKWLNMPKIRSDNFDVIHEDVNF